MEIRPDGIRLIVRSAGGDWLGYARACMAVLAESPLGRVEGWEAPLLGLSGTGSPDAAIEGPLDAAAGRGEHFYLDLVLGADTVVTLQPGQAGPGSRFSFRVEREVDAADTDESLTAFLATAAEAARGLAARTEAVWATLIPVHGGAACIPAPPLVEHNSHLVLTTEEEVGDNYDSPEAFWDCGWDSIEEFGARRLLLRGMDAVCGPEYLARIIGPQWRLARAAGPRRTGYGLPQPEPSEMSIFRAGRAQLERVGYVAAERTVEYSSTLARGSSIPGWEIYELWNLVQEGKLSDGRPVDTVRVVFLEEWAARQEKRPLLDIGCRVSHYDAAGELRELTE